MLRFIKLGFFGIQRDHVFPGTAVGVIVYYNKTDEPVNIQRFCFVARTNTDSVFESCQVEHLSV